MASSGPLSILVSIAITQAVLAQVVPTTPGPNETYIAGSPCKVAWNVDETGAWKNMTVGAFITVTISNADALKERNW